MRWCEESAKNLGWALGELVEELRQQRRDCGLHRGPLEAKKQRGQVVGLAIWRGQTGGSRVRIEGAQMPQHLGPLQTSALYLAPLQIVL